MLLKTVTLTSLFRFDLMPEIMSRRDFWKSEIPIVLYCCCVCGGGGSSARVGAPQLRPLPRHTRTRCTNLVVL